MKQIPFVDLKDLNDGSLSDIIDKWKDYDAETVTLAYSILKKRNSKITESYNYRLVQFMEANSIANINYHANEILKKRGIQPLSLSEEERSIFNSPSDQQTSEASRFPALTAISSWYFVLSWIIGLTTIAVSLYYVLNDNPSTLLAIVSFVSGLILTLGILATSNIIDVVLEIEKNTRKASKT